MADRTHRRCCTTTLTALAHIPADMSSKITEDGLSFSARTLVHRFAAPAVSGAFGYAGSMQNVAEIKKLRALNPRKKIQRPELMWLNRPEELSERSLGCSVSESE